MRILCASVQQVVLSCCAVLAWPCLAGCGNSCFVAVSNNGSGSVLVKAGDPPPVCSPHPMTGMVRAVVHAKKVCEACSAEQKVEHLFVTVRGVEIHAGTVADENSLDWVELAPGLRQEPRQVDLMAANAPEILAQNAAVPAAVYRQMRVRFADNESEKMTDQNACGVVGWNCLVMGDGRVEPLSFTGNPSELLMHLEGGEMVILPDTQNQLRLSLDPVPLGLSLDVGKIRVRQGLLGSVAMDHRGLLESHN
jgi:hypothetical protein